MNRNSFYIDVYKENLIITRKNNEFYNIKLSELEKEDKKIKLTKYKINEAFNTKRFIFTTEKIS